MVRKYLFDFSQYLSVAEECLVDLIAAEAGSNGQSAVIGAEADQKAMSKLRPLTVSVANSQFRDRADLSYIPSGGATGMRLIGV